MLKNILIKNLLICSFSFKLDSQLTSAKAPFFLMDKLDVSNIYPTDEQGETGN